MSSPSFLSLIFLALVLVGCGPGQGVSTQPSGGVSEWVEHALQADGLILNFVYPKGWTIQRGAGSDVRVSLSGVLDEFLKEPPPHGGGAVSITVIAKDEEELLAGTALEDFAKLERFLSIRAFHGDFMSAVEIESDTLGQLGALSFTLESPLESDAAIILRNRVVVADLVSHWLRVSYVTRADLFEKYQPIFDAISASFRVERSS